MIDDHGCAREAPAVEVAHALLATFHHTLLIKNITVGRHVDILGWLFFEVVRGVLVVLIIESFWYSEIVVFHQTLLASIESVLIKPIVYAMIIICERRVKYLHCSKGHS
jgi:hypothetical protein